MPEMDEKRRMLFVVGFQFGNVVGGHLLSAITIAKYLTRRGHTVGLLADIQSETLHDLDSRELSVHYAPYGRQSRPGILGHLPVYVQRLKCILGVVRKHRYDLLVAMDWYAALHGGPAAALFDLPMVQVQAGGEVSPHPPLCLPGYIVFSRELLEGIPARYNMPTDYLILSPGRVDFGGLAARCRNSAGACRVGFSSSSPRILVVSRLAREKEPAIRSLLNEVRTAGQHQPIELIVVGDGECRRSLENRAGEIMRDGASEVTIRFLGGFRIRPDELCQADLVVGQGRTVIEAVACGVPAAVCGNDGYVGLLTAETLPLLARSNLTGRGLEHRGSLQHDLDYLAHHQREQHCQAIRSLVADIYDADHGAEGIERALELIRSIHPDPRRRRSAFVKAYVRCLRDWLHSRKLQR